MRRTFVAFLGIAAALAARSGEAALFTGKPPMIGDLGIAATAVALDAQGNRYVTGLFYLTADFDPGVGVQNRAAVGSGAEVFVSKFDSAGFWVWTQTFGGTGTDDVAAIAVANGVVYVAGGFDSNDAGFGGSGTISANSGGLNYGAAYVLALDAATGAKRTSFRAGTGANTFGGSGGGRAAATALLVNGNSLYVAGTFNTSSFGIGGSGTTDSTGQYDSFVVALDTRNGESMLSFGALGLQTFGGAGDDAVRGLAYAGGVLYVAGDTGSMNFGVGGTGSISTGKLNELDAFVAALDGTTAAPVAAFGGDGVVTFGATGSVEEGFDVATAGGVVYLVGTGNGAGATIDGAGAPRPMQGGRDVFVLAVSAADGTPTSAFAGGLVTIGGGESEGRPTGVAATATSVYVTGALGTADAGVGGPGEIEEADAFVLALDPATGGALAGFAGDGVQTVTGGDPSGIHQIATITGLAASSGAVVLVGEAPVGAFVGPAATKMKFPGVGAFVLVLEPASADPLNLTGSNRRPVFSTPVIATPNPAVAGKPVRFAAGASDPDRNALRFAWDFGDGTTSKAKAASKKYATAGAYSIGATADDGKGGQTAATGIDLVVLPANTPYFDVTKANVALKFNVASSDSVAVSGQIPLADGTSLAGKTLTVDVGGVSKTFTLDALGRSPKGLSSATVSRPKGGVAKFAVKFPRADYSDELADEGMTDSTTVARYTPTLVVVIFDGVEYEETFPLLWTAKLGKSGAAK